MNIKPPHKVKSSSSLHRFLKTNPQKPAAQDHGREAAECMSPSRLRLPATLRMSDVHRVLGSVALSPLETQRPASLADLAPPVLGPPLLLRRPSAPWLSLPEHPASSRSARGGTASGLSLSLQLHAGLTLLQGRWFLSPAVQGVRVLPSTPHSKRMKVQGSGFEHS